MKAFFFGNMYLSDKQQGIQAAHVIGEMAVKYSKGSMLHEWAEEHKTIILKNGGESINLGKIKKHFASADNPYNWGYFNESGIDNALSSVGIILPEEAYQMARVMREFPNNQSTIREMKDLTVWEVKLYEILNSCRLA